MFSLASVVRIAEHESCGTSVARVDGARSCHSAGHALAADICLVADQLEAIGAQLISTSAVAQSACCT